MLVSGAIPSSCVVKLKPALFGGRMKVVIEGLEEGQVAVVTVIGTDYLDDDDPDPGEELPEETSQLVRTVIGKVVNL